MPSMDKTSQTISELASLFRMLQVIPDAESVGKVHQMLLAFCTTWRHIGFERGFILLVDDRDRVVRGHLAANQTAGFDPGLAPGNTDDQSFAELARQVFANYEEIESSALTIKTRTFSLPLDWQRSAVVRCIESQQPIHATDSSTDLRTDPFLGFFGTSSYVAFPLVHDGRVTAVLAADNALTHQRITLDDVSLVSSLVQHAGGALQRLMAEADNQRKFRIMRKLQEMLRDVHDSDKFNDAANLILSMVCRSMDGAGCFLKDTVRSKTTHIKSVDEYSLDADDTDIEIGEVFEGILDRAQGLGKAIAGDAVHPLVSADAMGKIRCFYATPLMAGDECYGAIGIYVGANDRLQRVQLESRNVSFFELCAAQIGERLGAISKSRQLKRSQSVLRQVQVQLATEKATGRVAGRSEDFLQTLSTQLRGLREYLEEHGVADTEPPADGAIIGGLNEYLDRIERDYEEVRSDVERIKSNKRMVDLFEIVGSVANDWKPNAPTGVSVTLRVPPQGPTLLMNPDSIAVAMRNVLRVLNSSVVEGDKVLVECTTTKDKAVVCVADTGTGLPGSALSRLFMPFLEGDDASDNALSVAADIIHQHQGEVLIRSSASWKTILLFMFPMSANSDRRASRDRRRRKGRDRRGTRQTTSEQGS